MHSSVGGSVSPEEIVATEWRRVLGETITEDLIARLTFDALQALSRAGWTITREAER
jgi:hypothetical protein